MKAKAFIFLVILWVFSCNQVNILEPVDPGAEPTEALKVVTTRFPNATDLVFKVVLAGNVWEVGFTNAADKYLSLVNETKMFETFKLRPDTLPLPLTDFMPRSVFAGGTFSDNAEDIDFYQDYTHRNRLVYKLNGVDYTFEFFRNRGAPYTPVSVMQEMYRYHVPLWKASEYPAVIRDYLMAHKDLIFIYGEARVKLNYEKHFYLRASITRNNREVYGDMLLDDKGKLLWTNSEFNLPPSLDPASNIDTLPEPIQNYLNQNPEMSAFNAKPQDVYKWKSEYDGVSSYYLKLSRDVMNTYEFCEIYFDQDGNLLNRRIYTGF